MVRQRGPSPVRCQEGADPAIRRAPRREQQTLATADASKRHQRRPQRPVVGGKQIEELVSRERQLHFSRARRPRGREQARCQVGAKGVRLSGARTSVLPASEVYGGLTDAENPALRQGLFPIDTRGDSLIVPMTAEHDKVIRPGRKGRCPSMTHDSAVPASPGIQGHHLGAGHVPRPSAMRQAGQNPGRA